MMMVLGKLERISNRITKKSDIENTNLQEFARVAANYGLKTTEKRKQLLYSLISDKNIQNLISENRVEVAKTATLELLDKWEDLTVYKKSNILAWDLQRITEYDILNNCFVLSC